MGARPSMSSTPVRRRVGAVEAVDEMAPAVEHGALVDVALVGDLAGVDRRRLVEQQHPADAPGRATGGGVVGAESLADVAADLGVGQEIGGRAAGAGEPGGRARIDPQQGADLVAVVALTAAAMGIRNATVRRLGLPDLTTTVLTLTLTGFAADSSIAGGTNPRPTRRIGSVIAMFSGALVGAAPVLHGSLAWPLIMACGAAAITTTVHAQQRVPTVAPAPPPAVPVAGPSPDAMPAP
jgi:hypothetical protein